MKMEQATKVLKVELKITLYAKIGGYKHLTHMVLTKILCLLMELQKLKTFAGS
jgi:hypothetical protein